MATRRKYGPRAYKTGGAVIPDPAPTGPPPPLDDAADAMREALEAQERAEAILRDPEELRRVRERQAAEQAAQQKAAWEQQIDAMPVKAETKSFLKRHPHVLHPQNADAVNWHLALARRDGIEDESEEMQQRILDGIREEAELVKRRRAEMAERAIPIATVPPAMPRDIDHDADQLVREADNHMTMMNAEAATPMEIAESLEEKPPASVTLPGLRRQKSVPMTAPVSREVRGMTGQRVGGSLPHLSREEAEIARNSMSWLPPHEAEYAYAKNKAKLGRMRSDGTYPETERN